MVVSMKKGAGQRDKGGTASFGRGFADALPICFGYFAVGFTVAVAAVVHGHPVWSPLLMSVTHVSGTSQGAIAGRVDFTSGPMAGWWEVALLCLALNLRYVLLALALAQKLPPGTGFGKRLLLAYGVTDENVAVAVSRPFGLSFRRNGWRRWGSRCTRCSWRLWCRRRGRRGRCCCAWRWRRG